LLNPVHRRVQANSADDVRSAGLEASGRVEESRLLERHLFDHRAAALPWRQIGEQLGASPEAADAGWAVELVGGISVEIGAQGRDIDRKPRHGLASIEQQQCALGMRNFPSNL